MSRVDHPATAIKPPYAACGEPSGGGGVPHLVRVKTGDTRHPPVAGERGAGRRRGCPPPVRTPGTTLRGRPGGGRGGRGGSGPMHEPVCGPNGATRPLPPLPRLTVTSRAEVNVCDLQPDHFTRPHSRLGHEPHNRVVAASVNALPWQALIKFRSSSSVNASTTFLSSLGCFTPISGSLSSSPHRSATPRIV